MAKKTITIIDPVVIPEQTKEQKVAELSAQINASLKPEVPAPVPGEKTTARTSVWGGTLQFGLLSFAVKTYKATNEEHISFNQLHAVCHARLRQGSMRCEVCDRDVPKEEITSGYAYGDGQYAVVTDDEKASCEPASDKTLEIVRFVKANEIDPVYFGGRTEFVGPGGDKKAAKEISSRGYGLLLAGMKASGTVALAKRSARGREQWVVLRVLNDHTLAASDLLFGNEVRAFDKSDGVAVPSQPEVELATKLIENMTEKFDEYAQSDAYANNMRALLNTKMQGAAVPVFTKKAEPAASIDILAALQASLSGKGKAA